MPLKPHKGTAGADVFISYAREDRPCAERLAAALAERGLRVWWDRELVVGAKYAEVIEDQIRRARAVLVLWSTDSVRSGFVKDEAGRARDAGKLHPVKIGEVQPPLGFGQLHTLDLLTCDTDNVEFARLTDQLVHAPGATPVTPVQIRGDGWRRAGRSLLETAKSRAALVTGAVALALGVAYLGHLWWTSAQCRGAFELTMQGAEILQEGGGPAETAVDYFDRAIAQCSTLATAYRYRGEALARSLDYDLAIADLQRAEALGLEPRARRRSAALRARIASAMGAHQEGQMLAVQRLGLESLAAASPPHPAPAAEPGAPDPAESTLAGMEPSATDPGDGFEPPAPEPEVSGPAPIRLRWLAARPADGPAAPAALRPSPVPVPGESTVAEPRPAAPLPVRPDLPPPVAAPAPGEPLEVAVDQLFSADPETRSTATTNLLLDRRHLTRAVPLALNRALEAAPESDGVVATLVFLQAAGPAVLATHREAVEELLARVEDAGPRAKAAAGRVRAALFPLVYLHIGDERQRPFAVALRAALIAEGFEVPAGIENVSAKANLPQAQPEIRVQGSSSRGAAQIIGLITRELGAAEPRILSLRGVNPKRDTYELWLDRQICLDRRRNPPACGQP